MASGLLYPSMDRVRKDEQFWTTLDALHRQSLESLVASLRIGSRLRSPRSRVPAFDSDGNLVLECFLQMFTYHRRKFAPMLYFLDRDSWADFTSALAKLSMFLSTTNVATASFNACSKAAGAASPWTQLATSLSPAKESIDHCW